MTMFGRRWRASWIDDKKMGMMGGRCRRKENDVGFFATTRCFVPRVPLTTSPSLYWLMPNSYIYWNWPPYNIQSFNSKNTHIHTICSRLTVSLHNTLRQTNPVF